MAPMTWTPRHHVRAVDAALGVSWLCSRGDRRVVVWAAASFRPVGVNSSGVTTPGNFWDWRAHPLLGRPYHFARCQVGSRISPAIRRRIECKPCHSGNSWGIRALTTTDAGRFDAEQRGDGRWLRTWTSLVGARYPLNA